MRSRLRLDHPLITFGSKDAKFNVSKTRVAPSSSSFPPDLTSSLFVLDKSEAEREKKVLLSLPESTNY